MNSSGTLGWLGVQYFASEEFKALDAQSQKTRRGVLEECFEEPHKDDDPERIGNCPLVHLAPRHIKRLRDLKTNAGLKGAANNRRKYLSAMFGWAVEQDPPLLKSNPARDVRRVKYATSGFHTWTPDEVRQFEERHPIGTKARLALALLLFTGMRRQDMVKLGKQHVRAGYSHDRLLGAAPGFEAMELGLRTYASPGDEMCGRREPAHVDADL